MNRDKANKFGFVLFCTLCPAHLFSRIYSHGLFARETDAPAVRIQTSLSRRDIVKKILSFYTSKRNKEFVIWLMIAARIQEFGKGPALRSSCVVEMCFPNILQNSLDYFTQSRASEHRCSDTWMCACVRVCPQIQKSKKHRMWEIIL